MTILLLQPKEVGVLLAVAASIVLLIRFLTGCWWQHAPAIVRGTVGRTDLAAALASGLRCEFLLLLGVVCLLLSLLCLLGLLSLLCLLLLLLLRLLLSLLRVQERVTESNVASFLLLTQSMEAILQYSLPVSHISDSSNAWQVVLGKGVLSNAEEKAERLPLHMMPFAVSADRISDDACHVLTLLRPR